MARDQPGLRRGTEATWQRPGGPRRRRTGRAQPSGREATRPRGRPCGAPRAGSVRERIMKINRGVHSPIYTRQRIFFSPCGTMFPHGSYRAGHVAARWASDPVDIDRKASIAWTRVHAIGFTTRAGN